jgi:hypothetical protein
MKLVKMHSYLLCLVSVSLLLASCGTNHGSLYGNTSGGGGGSSSTSTFTISGTVTGLVGTGLILQDNGTDNLTIMGNGAFTFATAVSGPYTVTIKTQPSSPTQTCTLVSATGTATADIVNVQVNCGNGNGLTIGGSVSGLIGAGLILQNNGGNNLPISGLGNVNFTFSAPITQGTAYAVTILTQPSNPAQICTVTNGTGTVSGNVTNVQIICPQPGFTISGSVVGLVTGAGDTLELQLNAGDDQFVTGDTGFTFATPVTNGGIYNVSLFLPPSSQPQSCNLFNYTGIASANVNNVIVDCQHNDWNWLTWYISTSNLANQYSVVTTPLFPPNELPPADLGIPGGRDFAASWTDTKGRKWLFGGNGYPYPSPYGNQLPGFLNDLWVFDGAWVPANLPVYVNTANVFVDNVTPLYETDASGFYGTLHMSTNGVPGGRWGSSTWTDAAGNLWMFGGQGYDASTIDFTLLNDVWEWIPGGPDPEGAGTFTGEWIWQGGSSIGNQKGAYGTKNNPSTANLPGGRWAAATYTDSVGNVWLFGGQGLDSAGTTGLLADLWKYNIASQQWTWVSGSNIAGPNGAYGAKETAGPNNAPGGRQNATLWVDTAGNVWLFGGFGFDSTGTGAPEGAILNDLWEFTGGQWVWVSGDNLANQTGVYGTQLAAAATNVPGSRWGAVGWSDANNNLWFFGGWGYGTTTTDPTGFLNDIWEYQHSTGQWIWWKGTSNANQNGSYLTDGIPYVNNVVGARRGSAIWQPGVDGYVWIFGGEGYDSSPGTPPGYLDDLWTYLPFLN